MTGDTDAVDRPTWLDTLFLVSVAAAVVVAATAVLLVITRPDDAVANVAASPAPTAVVTPTSSSTTTTSTSTSTSTTPTTTSTVPPAPVDPLAGYPPEQQQYLRAVRLVIPVATFDDPTVIDNGLEQCRLISDMLAIPGSEGFSRPILISALSRNIVDAAKGDERTRRILATILWSATQHLCPEHHGIAQEALPAGP